MFAHISKICLRQGIPDSLTLPWTNLHKCHHQLWVRRTLIYYKPWNVRPKTCSVLSKVVQPITLRYKSGLPSSRGDSKKTKTVALYFLSVGIVMVGLSYAGVPLYKIFCQATGLGGQAVQGHDVTKVETMKPVKDRVIRIQFNADTASSMQWNFKPQQNEIKVLPGETALAFYTAKNPTNEPIIGISTYNVIPYEAGPYFNKIQCFCFEEQRLNPHEQVDMPVFFYIDPEFAEDPKLQYCDQITLSYTFFQAKKGFNIPLPGYMQTPQ